MLKYLVAIAIIVAGLPACCPMVSVNPLSEPDGIDERLFGVWKPESKEGAQAYLHIGRKSDTIMVALSIEHMGNGKLHADRMPFSLTRTGKHNYWNVRFEDLDEGLAKGYEGFFFLKYVFADKDTLLVAQLGREPIIAAIQAQKLRGQITFKPKRSLQKVPHDNLSTAKSIDCVTLSDTSQNILSFIETGDFEALFPDAMRFTRIKSELQ